MFRVWLKLLSSVWLLATVLALSPHAVAQGLEPEVQIDTSILRDLNPSGTGSAYDYQAVPLKRPSSNKNFQPRLTPPEPKAIQFPVQTRTRTDSNNPSLPTGQQIIHSGLINVPLPGRKPRFENGSIAIKRPPLPKKRPYTKDLALAAELKALRDNTDPNSSLMLEKENQIPAAVLKADTAQGKPLANAPKTMPAVPAGKVAVEILPGSVTKSVPSVADELASSLVKLDRQTVLETIESMGINDAPIPVPLPEPKPVELIRTSANPLQRINHAELIDITAKSSSFADKAAKPQPEVTMAAVGAARQPAQGAPGGDTATFKLISVPFSAGFEELDDTAAQALEEKILPALRDHPAWQLQIQSFASAAGQNMNSARRLSLSRALNVRSWLLDRGIEARRMEVRALGSDTEKKPLDRVDFVLFNPAVTAN